MSKSQKVSGIIFTFFVFLFIFMQSWVDATIEVSPSLEGLEYEEVNVDTINNKKPENIDENLLNNVETYGADAISAT